MRRKSKSLAVFVLLVSAFVYLSCSPEPAKIEIVPATVVLEGADAKQKLEAKVLDKDGNVIPDAKIIWFADDPEHIKLSADGTVTAVASGESKVEAEVVNTKIKGEVPIRIKIAGSIHVSHERLRLWTGQVKENVWAEVRSEKDAFVEGYRPHWETEDPEIVKVEDIKDNRRQSFVRMTGMKSGTTYIAALYKNFSKRIRVAVYDEDEEVAMDGTRIPKKTEEESTPKKKKKGKKKKKKKGKKK